MLPLHNYARLLVIDTPMERDLQPATLFLFLNSSEDGIFLTNIVPDAGALSHEEYNAIVMAYYQECIQTKAQNLLLVAALSSDEVRIENTFSPRNMALLHDFVRNANKNTGSANPYDYRRWLDFIAASTKDGEFLAPDLLQQWLTEQGFSSDAADDLRQEYQFGVDLTKHWAGRLQEQEAAVAAQ